MGLVDFYLKKVYQKWHTLMNSIITGSCGCIKTCTIYYKDPVLLDNCDPYDQREEDHGYSDQCNYQLVSEEIDIAVFTDEKKFIRVENLVNVPNGVAQTVTNEAVFIKLKQCEYIEFKVANALVQKRYKRYSDGDTVGFNDDYKFYVLLWEKC